MLMPLLPGLLRRCSNTSRAAAPAAHRSLPQRRKNRSRRQSYSTYRLLGRGVDRRAGLLLQFFQLFLQERQARDQRAIRVIRDRLLLHLIPSRVGILFVPRTFGLDVECSLRGEIIKRTTIVLEIKNAIAQLEIKIAAVQVAAMTQAGRKISLRHLGVENLGLEIVKGIRVLRVLRLQRAAQRQCQQSRREPYFPSPVKTAEMSIDEKFYTIRE
jgi:hypothetical protein